MPQQTNLNVSPYFDDFDPNSDYYKVLFKPGYPVQARELTTLQSILQNQIEKFGLSIYKEGAKVIPGNFGYLGTYDCIQLSNSYLGIPVDAYVKQLQGIKIVGQTSGVSALVVNSLLSTESEKGNSTLYIQYLSSSTQNNSNKTFLDGETLVTESEILSGLLGNTAIQAGSPFATTIPFESTAVGSAFSISNGVYFIRGQFIPVSDETLILDQYTNNPTYRIGLYITETIVNSDIDETLNDNAQGFTNYAAPGADRLSISVALFKKAVDDLNDANFIELCVVRNGKLTSKKINDTTRFIDELARRTWNEMGDYYVTPYTIDAKESLNDYRGNQGIFEPSELTPSGNVPDEDLGIYKVSPGKAIIRGWEVQNDTDTFLEFPKTRTTQTLTNQSVVYSTGSTLKLNRVYGSPQIGVGNTYVLSLRDSRVGDIRIPGIASTIAPGKEIGVARVYDFNLESGAYDLNNTNLNQWDISLYDIQTTTEITLNEPITLSAPIFIQGENSGAKGFLKNSVINSKNLSLYDVSGEFVPNESFIFDGIQNTRVAVAVTAYNISDVKSVYGSVGIESTFTADVVQYRKYNVGLATISPSKYFRNVVYVNATIKDTVPVGFQTIFLNDTGFISIGSSVTIGSGQTFTNVPITGIGFTLGSSGTLVPAINIGAAFTSRGTTLNTIIGFQTSHGSTVIFVDSGRVGASLTDVGVAIGSSITTGSLGEFRDRPIIGIGNTFVIVGAAFTSREVLRTTLSVALNAGDTTIFIGSTAGVSIGSSMSIGSGAGIAHTYVPVTSIGNTFVTIGSATTTPYTATVGAAVTFLNISSIVPGLAVTFTNVSAMPIGAAVSISYVLNTSTVIDSNPQFPGNLIKNNNLISYTDVNYPNKVYAKVVSVGGTSFEIASIQPVSGINSSTLPSTITTVSDLQVISTNLDSSSDNSFYTRLPKRNIASVDLNGSTLIIRKTYKVNISGNRLSTVLTAATNETFLPFDEERYTLVRSDGSYEVLTSDKFEITNGGTELQIYGLGSDNIGATLVATLTKINVKAKVKRKNRVSSIIVDKSKYSYSGIGSTTINDGLTYGNYPYGTRVQDEIISLNSPDIVEFHAIFESFDQNNASAPTVVFSSINSPTGRTTDLIVGEIFTGESSSASAIVAEVIDDSKISFLMKNDLSFREGETITCQESGIQCVIRTIENSSVNISGKYVYGIGQNKFFYDYGYIKRKADAQSPTRKLKIYFSSAYYDQYDDGDITTVNSYSNFDYKKDVQFFDGVKNSDIIDVRPRVSNYVVSEGARSPLEFYGRTFTQTGNSAANILASDENVILDYSFYLPRIDRIFLTKDGVFQVKYGSPAENPERPILVDDAIEIATATIPAYLYDIADIEFDFLEYKRYQMSDIRQLERRIQNLEYYTSLSLLETKTENLFISDEDGLNKFKSGFFVDNFTSLVAQEDGVEIKNSIDPKTNELRASHYTNSLDITAAPVASIGSTITQFIASEQNPDLQYTAPTGINVRKNRDIVTLDYSEVVWLAQNYATRTENVTPFVITFWQGVLELTPASDTWVSTQRLEARTINAEGNFASVMADATRRFGVNPQTGLAPTVWGSWQTVWTGSSFRDTRTTRTDVSGGGWVGGEGIPLFGTRTVNTWAETTRTTTLTGTSTRTGTRTAVVEQINRTSLGDRTVSRDLIPFMRSRNITWVGKRVKPSTQLYAFFDGINVTRFCTPKLLEIEMRSGVFRVGETVIGYQKSPTTNNWILTRPNITFRVASPNHADGNFNAPTEVYPQNPYTGQLLPSLYSSTSTILNIDLYSLSNQPQGQFFGWVSEDMLLVGQNSGAQARITSVRLVSDFAAEVRGSFFVPPDVVGFPQFRAGTKVFTLINNTSNSKPTSTTFAENNFTSQGTLEVVQENILAVRNARIEVTPTSESRSASETTTSLVSTQLVSSSSQQVQIGFYDPLAESFFVDDPSGIFLTKCDIFFKTKDTTNVPVTFQIRTVELGTPTTKILPFSEIVLRPDRVNLSDNGAIPTTFTFDAPVYLEGQKEYCIVLLSNSSAYNVFISRVGENDLITKEFISTQPYLGSLFKSQNGTTWDPSQWEDLKFILYRANFLNSGTLDLRNPPLSKGNKQIANLLPDSLIINSRRLRVGLAQTVIDPNLVLGATIRQANTNASGNYVGSAGSAFSTLSIINPGIGYTPSFTMGGSFTFVGVALTSITGTGVNATANITVTNGVAIAATINVGGRGYQIGDVLSVTQLGSSPEGRDLRLSVVSIASTNELLLDNVQGDFATGVGGTVTFINSVGLVTTLNSSVGGNVLINSIRTVSDGTSITVNHKNHGMYFRDNYVRIEGVESDVLPTQLALEYSRNSVAPLSIQSINLLNTFENIGVGTTNVGYVLVDDEVISYTSTSGNQIGGIITRGIDGTIPRTHPVGALVQKYELGGVSLRRINKIHYLGNYTGTAPLTFDSYTLPIDMSSASGIGRSDGSSFPKLYFNETKYAGGANVFATQNMPYEVITPMIQNLTVRGTTINSEIRTVTGKSINGNEIPYVDKGYESISINESNYLDSTRIICSQVNEYYKLGNIPDNKSFNIRLTMSTLNPRVSPVVDLERTNIILTSNRIDRPITNYAADRRVNSIDLDPTSCQFVSKETNLVNPATSIQIILDAHINTYSDIRAFYAIDNKQNFDPIFVPFPGWDNLDSRGQIISVSNSNGKPDSYIPQSSSLGFATPTLEFKEYKFTIKDLPSFNSYRIKINLTESNRISLMDNYIKVEGFSNLVRDPQNNSIINTNMAEYDEYVKRKELKNKENQKIQNLEEDLASMKGDINEIKSLLRSLIDGSR
jgi:hypothetical protein